MPHLFMKRHTIAGVITAGWLEPIAIFLYLRVFFTTDYVKSAQYGYCLQTIPLFCFS